MTRNSRQSSQLFNNTEVYFSPTKPTNMKFDSFATIQFQLQLIVIFFPCSALWKSVTAARILAVFPIPLASHCTTLQTVTIELAKRGHELVVFTGYSAGSEISELPNYQEIILEENAKRMPHTLGMILKNKNYLMFWWESHKLLKIIGELTLQHPIFRELTSPKSRERFDLIMIEWIGWDALNSLGYRFNAPVIGIASIPLNNLGRGTLEMGLPFNMIDEPNFLSGVKVAKTFLQRLKGLAMEIAMTWIHYHALSGQQELVEKYFGKDYPHVYDSMKNVSMIFGTQDSLMPYPTIGVPNMINMGGIHVRRKYNQVIPKKMRDFMEGGKGGVIYFSLGSTMKGVETSRDVRGIFLQTFSELPYRVLWKWENDTLPGRPENVFISKWMPQRAILAHPSVKVFIYQGGLQSTEEAIFAGVPLIGIPLFADQPRNVKKMVSAGVAVDLNMDSLTKEKMKSAILEVVNDEKYKLRMIEFRNLINDRPYDSLEYTMWWIDYVIRHKGARHLKIARANLPWYQLNHIDTLGFLYLVILLIILILYKIMKFFLFRLLCRWDRKNTTKKVKSS